MWFDIEGAQILAYSSPKVNCPVLSAWRSSVLHAVLEMYRASLRRDMGDDDIMKKDVVFSTAVSPPKEVDDVAAFCAHRCANTFMSHRMEGGPFDSNLADAPDNLMLCVFTLFDMAPCPALLSDFVSGLKYSVSVRNLLVQELFDRIAIFMAEHDSITTPAWHWVKL